MVQTMDSKMNKKLLINGWSVCVGSMDTITGILLIFMPDLVLKLLGIAHPDNSSWVFLSWMGVFITGVGLSYIWALGNATQGKVLWKFTAMIRLMVAGFISWKIVAGELQLAWLLVAISDAFVALIQFVILRLDWWREVDS
jgi:hypothetical protein